LPGSDEWSVFSKYQSSSDSSFNLEFGVEPNGLYTIVTSNGIYNSGDEYDSPADILPTDGNWHFYAFVYQLSAGTVTAYIDSIPYTLTRRTSLNHASFFNSGGIFKFGSINNSRFINMHMDEISIFPSPLSSTDINTIYNSGTPLDYSSGLPPDPPATTTPTTTPLSSTGDIVFMLAVIIFFLGTMWIGFVFSIFRSKK